MNRRLGRAPTRLVRLPRGARPQRTDPPGGQRRTRAAGGVTRWPDRPQRQLLGHDHHNPRLRGHVDVHRGQPVGLARLSDLDHRHRVRTDHRQVRPVHRWSAHLDPRGRHGDLHVHGQGRCHPDRHRDGHLRDDRRRREPHDEYRNRDVHRDALVGVFDPLVRRIPGLLDGQRAQHQRDRYRHLRGAHPDSARGPSCPTPRPSRSTSTFARSAPTRRTGR